MIDKLSKELEPTDPYYVNRLMTKGVITDIICKPFGELKNFSFYAVKFFFV